MGLGRSMSGPSDSFNPPPSSAHVHGVWERLVARQTPALNEFEQEFTGGRCRAVRSNLRVSLITERKALLNINGIWILQ